MYPSHGQRWSLLVPGAADTVQQGVPRPVPKGLYSRQHRVGASASSPEACASPRSPLLERLSPAKLQASRGGCGRGCVGKHARVSPSTVALSLSFAPSIAIELERISIRIVCLSAAIIRVKTSWVGLPSSSPARLAGRPARRPPPAAGSAGFPPLLLGLTGPCHPLRVHYPIYPTTRLEEHWVPPNC